jgi:DNA-binding XRE family transcriptional regulator
MNTTDDTQREQAHEASASSASTSSHSTAAPGASSTTERGAQLAPWPAHPLNLWEQLAHNLPTTWPAPGASTPARDSLATIKPTPDQIRAARTLASHSQDEAAQLVHVTGRAWRRWESGEREISGAAWELYLIKALGFVPIKLALDIVTDGPIIDRMHSKSSAPPRRHRES